jgi:prepilin signal peptidase PulO-like enzyme (type II secretory pathway)
VKYQDLAPKPWIAGAIAGALGFALSIFALARSSFSLTVAVASAMFGLLYALGTRLDAGWRWIVLLMIVVGLVAISALPLDREWLGALSIGFLGLILFVDGGITLYLYLHRTRPQEQEAL